MIKLFSEHTPQISTYYLLNLKSYNTLSLNPIILFRLPYTRAVENGGLNRSPGGFLRTPPSQQPRLLRVRSSLPHGSRHRAPLLLLKNNIHFNYDNYK
jgi:hypothetical protein